MSNVVQNVARFGFQLDQATMFRIVTEDYARDSFENLLFSVCRFREYTGRYPRKITGMHVYTMRSTSLSKSAHMSVVVGLDFKEYRFINLHRAALRYPMDQFQYIGIGGTAMDSNATKSGAVSGEWQNGVLAFSDDMYGCYGKLMKKRIHRNPYRRWHGIVGYPIVCPEMKNLFHFCSSGGSIYDGPLPW
jgi:hypothetical protein